jgi:hypothetical protein
MKKATPASPTPTTFGPVATIDTAPVAIGNSVSGSEPIVTSVRNGVRIQGRDFFCNLDSVAATLTDWYMVGGAPLIPHAMTSSLLKSYAGIYSQFIVNGIALHYITATSTGVQGDVMLYISKSIGNPMPDSLGSNFLSMVLSDKNTIIGPLWKNHTAVYFPPPTVYSTDILNDEDLTHRGPGELVVFTRSSSEQVPGYMLIDYDITFKTMQVNVRALTFPISKMKYFGTSLGRTATVATTNIGALVVQGTTLSGATPDFPSDAAVGDIYKMVLIIGAGTFSGCNFANFLNYEVLNGSGTETNQLFSLATNTTVYGVQYAVGSFVVYASYQDAVTQSRPLHYGVGAAINVNIPSYVSFVGTVGNPTYTQSHV